MRRVQRWFVRTMLAFAVAIPALLWSLDQGLRTPRLPALEVAFASSVPGQIQVFFDRGAGFTPEESVSAVISDDEGLATVVFAVPPGMYRRFRLDPPAAEGRFTVGRVSLHDARRRLLVETTGGALEPVWQLSAVNVGPLAVFNSPAGSNDPQLLWTLPAPVVVSEGHRSSAAALLAVCVVEFMAGLMLILAAERLLAPFGPHARRTLSTWQAWGAWHPRATIAAAALVATVAAMYPVVFLGKSLVSPNNGYTRMLYDRPPFVPGYEDTGIEPATGMDVGAGMWAFVPYSHVQRLALMNGELPLWNRYTATGRPLWGQGQSQILDPLHWVAILAPDPGLGWDIKFVLHRFVFALGVGVATFGVTGSWAAGVVVTLTAPFASYYLWRLNHAGQFVLTYAPWLMYFWGRLGAASTSRAMARASAGIALTCSLMLVASPHKEALLLLFCCHASGALACFLAIDSPRLLAGRLGAALFAAIAALLVSAPHWWIFFDTLAQSATSYEIPYARFATMAWAVALVFGASAPGSLLPGVHVVAATGALAALVVGRIRKRAPSTLGIALGPVIALAIAFGAIPAPVITSLPFVKNIQAIDYFAMTAAVPLTIIASGIGIAGMIRRRDQGSRRGTWWVIFMTAAGGISLALVLLSKAGVLASPFGVNTSALLFQIVLAALLVPLFRVAALSWPEPMPVATIGVVLLLIFLPNGLHASFEVPRFDELVFQPRTRVRLAAKSSAVLAVDRDKREPARVLGLGEVMYGGTQGLYELEGLGGPDALRLPRYEELIEASQVKRLGWVYSITGNDLPQLRPLLDLLNVGYTLAARRVDGDLLPHGADSDVSLQLDHSDRLSAARRPTRWPRAYYVDAVSQYTDVSEFVTQLEASTGPFASVDGTDPAARALVTGGRARNIVPADGYVLDANRTRFHIRTPGAGLVVLTEAWMADDFVATLNGVPKPYYRVNHAFKAIRIPASGDWDVSFQYWPRHLTEALTASAVGLLFLAGAAGFSRS